MIAGDRLGSYEIVAPLGSGGMGEVYKAHDTRLDRDVAVKILSASLASDSDAAARFEREALSVARLSHPNILAIYEFGRAPLPGPRQDVAFVATELVDGDTLRTRLAHGALNPRRAVAYAQQIARGIAAAHARGIVHRDLKPENVMITRDDHVKILDFGLAKPIAGVAAPSGEETRAVNVKTTAGTVLGTFGYMAPEQVRGLGVDHRADIFAFGAVLYEMLSGERAFKGETAADTITAILTKDPPDLDIAKLAISPALDRIVRRCLEKAPDLRFQSANDLAFALENLSTTSTTSSTAVVESPAAPARALASWLPWAIAALAVAAAAMLTVLRPWARPVAVPALARVSLLPPAGVGLYPDSTGVAISPDGTMVAFIVGDVSRSETQLWVRSLSSTTPRRLDDADGASLPFWSPDSRRIGFYAGGKLKTIAAGGGRSETLCDAPNGRGAAWNADNEILFAPDGGGPLYRISATGGEATPATALDTAKKEHAHRFPAFLPDGDHFLYASLPARNGQFDIYAGSLSGPPASRTHIGLMDSAPVFAEPGWLLYLRQGGLVAQAFDPASLKLTGDPIQMEDEPSMVLDPALSFTSGRPVSVSATGALAYYSSPSPNTVAEWYDAQGRPAGTLDIPAGHYDQISISPDGSHAIFVKSISPSESSLWLVDLTRGSALPLSSGKGRNDSPVWSPDGSRVAFGGDRDGPQNVYVKTIGDATPERPLYQSDVVFKIPAAWSPDGAWLVMNQVDPRTSQNIWLLPAGGGALEPFYAGPMRDNPGPISPDGRWMAYFSDDTGRFQLYVQSFPTPGHRVQVSQTSAVTMWWTRDSRQMVYLADDMRTLWRVGVTPAGAGLSIGTPVKLGTLPPNVTFVSAMPDLQKFLVLAPERTGTPSITVVQNWRAALAK